LVVRDGGIHPWRDKVQIVLPRSNLKEILGEIHTGSSGRNRFISQNLGKVRRGTSEERR
jgi:hypothetical protein